MSRRDDAEVHRLSPAALDRAIRQRDQPSAVKDFGDVLETGTGPEGNVNDEARPNGGEAGIRTLDTGFGPYNGLANRRLQPLGHLTALRKLSIYDIGIYTNAIVPIIVPETVPASSRNRTRTHGRRAGPTVLRCAAVFL